MNILADILWAMLLLSGAGSAEELGESEAERFQHYIEHPLRINQAPRSRMLSCGLLSSYQVAALQDYRSLYGDILGKTELSLIDGIGPENAEALSFFVSFESMAPPGAREQKHVRQSAMFRGCAREKGEKPECGLACKYHSETGERIEAFYSARTTYGEPSFKPGTLSLALYSRRGGKLILGDFCARFGQGLALWSGFSLSGFSSTAAFRRSATGFAPTGSFSASMRGAATEFSLGRWIFSAGLSVPGLRSSTEENKPPAEGGVKPILSASRYGQRGLFGIHAYCNKDGFVSSADGSLGLGHLTLFGEMALSSQVVTEASARIRKTRFAALGGVSWAPAYRVTVSALARYYPSGYYGKSAGPARSSSVLRDERGLALGAKWRWAEFTADAAIYPEKNSSQGKALLSLSPAFPLGRISLVSELRISERFRPKDKFPWRHDVRLDLKTAVGPWHGTLRCNLVRNRAVSGMSYAELGYKTQRDTAALRLSAFVRATGFIVDNRDDRIYCHERDVPGSFSVPALYGRGWSLSSVIGIRLTGRRIRHDLYLRASVLRYFTGTRQPATEVKLQYRIDLETVLK